MQSGCFSIDGKDRKKPRAMQMLLYPASSGAFDAMLQKFHEIFIILHAASVADKYKEQDRSGHKRENQVVA